MRLYRKNSKGFKPLVLLHCYSKLKPCEKWRLTRLALSKGKDGVIDLIAPLATSAGRAIGNKAAKAALLDAFVEQQVPRRGLLNPAHLRQKDRRKVGGAAQEA
jgi:hypothetical protein